VRNRLVWPIFHTFGDLPRGRGKWPNPAECNSLDERSFSGSLL
jgi:hypothetical protein